MRLSKTVGLIGLLLASFFWGAEFVVEKKVLSVMEANYSNAIRFSAASILCTLALMPQLRMIRKKDVVNGIITGCFMGFGFAFQTMGLSYIHAGENALLCSSYILMIPLAEWMIFKRNPGYRIFIYAAMALIGIFFISSNSSVNPWIFSTGEVLTLLGSLFYAGAIISIERLSAQTDSRILSLIQFYVITGISVFFALCLEAAPSTIKTETLLELGYLILFATIGAQLLMNYCIQVVSSSVAGIIFSSEAIFAAILGILFLNEPSGVKLWIGVLLIIGSITLYQTEIPIMRTNKLKSE